MHKRKDNLITAEQALPGRSEPMAMTEPHFIYQRELDAATPAGMEQLILGMGCFWGVERLFWQQAGVLHTSVGYCGGYTPNPTYQEVCSGDTGHAEVVRVVFDPAQISLEQLLSLFWQRHDPTQGLRQGNDIGSQYRSVLFVTEAQRPVAEQSRERYQSALQQQGIDAPITTAIVAPSDYYLAETYHQQYLAKNPEGYCGLGGTGVCFPA